MHCFFYLICLNTHEVVLLWSAIQLHIQYLLGVRTALYCFSLFVIHTKYFCFYIASIRLHDLDCITYAELVALPLCLIGYYFVFVKHRKRTAELQTAAAE